MDKEQFSGLILIDKPKDLTSFSVISRLRLLTGIKKIGHCGTLDPFATGLLPVLFGRYTRLAKYLENHDKYYKVTFTLGKATATLDLTSDVIAEIDPQSLEKRILSGELEQSLQNSLKNQFIGEIEQIPPMYSAIKLNGKPLYKYARAGEEIERKSRKVTIYDASLSPIKYQEGKWQIDALIHCEKGTYIRTWVDDLAKSVDCLAYAEELRRLQIGELKIEDKPVHLDDLFEIFNQNNRDQTLIRKILKEKYFYPINDILSEFPSYSLNQNELIDVSHGRKFSLNPDKINLFESEQTNSFQIEATEQSKRILLRLNYQNKLIALAKLKTETLEFDGYEKVLITNEELPFIK